jgi:branched-chain amino acid transport system substrate-binding protein
MAQLEEKRMTIAFTTTAAALARRIALGLSLIGVTIAPSGAQQSKLRIAVVTPLTGTLASVNVPGQNAAKMIIEAINAGTLPAPYNTTKGIAGREVEFIFIDEAGGNAKQVAEFRALAERRGADVVMGFGSSATCVAIAPVAEEMRVLTVMSTCAPTRIFEEADYKYVFRTTGHATMDGVALARYALSRWPDIKTFGGINPNFALGQDSWRDFSLAMKALRPELNVTVELWPSFGAGNYSAEITALSERKPDVTHTALAGTDIEAFIAQMAARGLNEQTKVMSSLLELSIHRMGPQIPDGVIFTARGPYGLFAPDSPLNTWFRQAYEDKFKEKAVFTAYQYARTLLGVKAAYEKAAAANGGAFPSTDNVVTAFTNLVFEAPGGTVKMAIGKGHQAINDTAVGEYFFDKEKNQPSVRNVMRFPAECVNPPADVKSEAWLRSGMPGAKCP